MLEPQSRDAFSQTVRFCLMRFLESVPEFVNRLDAELYQHCDLVELDEYTRRAFLAGVATGIGAMQALDESGAELTTEAFETLIADTQTINDSYKA